MFFFGTKAGNDHFAQHTREPEISLSLSFFPRYQIVPISCCRVLRPSTTNNDNPCFQALIPRTQFFSHVAKMLVFAPLVSDGILAKAQRLLGSGVVENIVIDIAIALL